MSSNNKLKKGLVFLGSSALIYSLMPVMIRFLDAGNVPPISQVFLRYVVAFFSAFIYFSLTKQNVPKLNNKLLLILVGVFGYGFTNLLFTYGVLYTQISNALFIFYCYAIVTPVFAYLILREKFNAYNVVATLVALVALFFLFQPGTIETWKLGGLFALLSALMQSFYLIGRRALNTYSSAFILLSSTLLGAIVMGALALVFKMIFIFLQEVLPLLQAKRGLSNYSLV